MTPWLLSITIAYLLGSVPFGYLLVRIFRQEDIRASGSGNIGATNVARSGARGLGIATLLLDLGKGVLAVVVAFLLANRAGLTQVQGLDLAVAAAVAVVVGHVFPVWLAFRGGKGVATALGVFIALVPRASLCILAVFLLIVAITRFVSLASILAAASFPLFGFYFVPHPSPTVIFGFLFIPLLIVVKHHANIGRLLAGTEPRFGKSSRKVAV